MLINARKQSLLLEYRAYSLSEPKIDKCNRTDNIREGGQVKKCFKWIPLTFRKKKCVSSRGWNATLSIWDLAHGLKYVSYERAGWWEGLAHRNWYWDIKYVHTHACTKTVGYSYTEQARPSFWSRPPIVRMQEIWCQMRVGERRVPNAGVSCSMRESWQLCSRMMVLDRMLHVCACSLYCLAVGKRYGVGVLSIKQQRVKRCCVLVEISKILLNSMHLYVWNRCGQGGKSSWHWYIVQTFNILKYTQTTPTNHTHTKHWNKCRAHT